MRVCKYIRTLAMNIFTTDRFSVRCVLVSRVAEGVVMCFVKLLTFLTFCLVIQCLLSVLLELKGNVFTCIILLFSFMVSFPRTYTVS